MKELIFKIRQVLNIIFMIAVIVGGLMYYFGPEDKIMAIIILATAVVLKMVEVVLRMLPK